MNGIPAAVRVVLPPGSVVVRAGEQLPAAGLSALPETTPASRIALVDSRIGSRRRLRCHAALLGLSVRSEYLVLPTWRHATFVVEDDRDTLAWLLSTLATVPPGLSRGVPIADLLLRLACRMRLPQRALTLAAPGRVLVGEPR